MAIRFRERPRKQVNLNMTSLIDVLFLLIIFFMLTGTFRRAGEMELHLPTSTTAQPVGREKAPQQVEVVMTEAGGVLLNGQATDLDRLQKQLADLAAKSPGGQAMIQAEAGVRHGDVVRVLDMIREAGFAGVGIGTQFPQSQPKTESH